MPGCLANSIRWSSRCRLSQTLFHRACSSSWAGLTGKPMRPNRETALASSANKF